MTDISKTTVRNWLIGVALLLNFALAGYVYWLALGQSEPQKPVTAVQKSRPRLVMPRAVAVTPPPDLELIYKKRLLDDTTISTKGWQVAPSFYHYLQLRKNKEIDDFDLCSHSDNSVIKCLASCSIKRLALHNSACDKDCFKDICSITALKELAIAQLKMPTEYWGEVRSLNNLKSLHLDRCQLTDDSLKLVDCHDYESLTIPGNPLVTDKGVAILRKQDLKTLDLTRTGVTDNCTPTLARMKSLKNLQLDIDKITDKSLPYLAKMNLESLDLSQTLITDEGLKHFRPRPTLKELIVKNCKQLSEPAIAAFEKRTPGCKVYTSYEQLEEKNQ